MMAIIPTPFIVDDTVGRVSKPRARLLEETVDVAMNQFGERNYYPVVFDHAMVGAAEGGGFEDSTELKPMKFKEAMATQERDKWLQVVKEEHENVEKYNMIQPVPLYENLCAL